MAEEVVEADEEDEEEATTEEGRPLPMGLAEAGGLLLDDVARIAASTKWEEGDGVMLARAAAGG